MSFSVNFPNEREQDSFVWIGGPVKNISIYYLFFSFISI